MANEITVPLLPCASINDMLAFYNAPGFETTYHQNKPNTTLGLLFPSCSDDLFVER